MSGLKVVHKVLGAVILASALPSVTRADYTIRRDSVVPVVFETQLSMRDNRVGDRFFVRVDRDRDLPPGTRLAGRINEIRRESGSTPGYMDLQFTDILLPDGRRVSTRAFPIPMDDRYVRRDRDGRFTATSNIRKRENMVIGGTVAGLILGGILSKPFEGAVLGAIAGVVLSENERKNGGDIVISKDQRMGALFEKETFVSSAPFDGRDDWRRDERYRDNKWNVGRNRDDRYRSDDWDRRDDRYDDRWDSRTERTTDRISYQDRDLYYPEELRPFRSEGVLMVPMLETARQLDLRVEEGRTGVYYLEDDDNSLRLDPESREYRFNGGRGTLPAISTKRDGVLFVPVEVFSKIKGEKIRINGNRLDATAF